MQRQLELPVFEAKKSKDFPSFLIVMCPRDDCIGTSKGRPFLVHGPTWLNPHRLFNERTQRAITIVGRSCPYCFRAARVPSRKSIR